jgi:hypothetical protein
MPSEFDRQDEKKTEAFTFPENIVHLLALQRKGIRYEHLADKNSVQ